MSDDEDNLPPPVDPNDTWWDVTADIDPPKLSTDAAATYEYRRQDGSLAFIVARWESHNGHQKKRFSPYCWDGREWVQKQLIPAGERPLWNLPAIIENYRAPILIVEGEKAAAAAVDIMPGWVVTTWAGGSSAVNTADWSSLEGRTVVIWPDNDEPGRKAAAAIKAKLPKASIVVIPLSFPEGWDLADPLPANYAADWPQMKLLAADDDVQPTPQPEAAAAPEQSLTFDPILWAGVPIPVRRWLVPDLIPWHVPVMLSGKGGLGKSLLGAQLAHASATKNKWLGREVNPVKVFAVFSEDDHDELHRRFAAINVNTGTEFGDLENLRLMVRDGEQSSLMNYPSPHEAGTESPFFDRLISEIKTFGAQLIILDSLYNFFHGNENNRVQVSQFVYCLRRIAKECDAALVFIAHPSKAGLSTGDGYAGSTAWHDAVRARLYLTEEENEGETRLVLNTMKANYAPREGQIEVFYQGGMLWPRENQKPNDATHYVVQVDLAFMNCLRACAQQGRRVTDSRYGSFAPKVFQSLKATNRGFTQIDFERAMARLFEDGKIKNGVVRDANRHAKEGIVEVQLTDQVKVEGEE